MKIQDNVQVEKEKLVIDTLYLIDIILKKRISITKNIPCMSYDDLYQAGCIALIKASKEYDLSQNVKFTTFASKVIYNGIIDEYRKHLTYYNRYNIGSLTDKYENGEDPIISLPDHSEHNLEIKAIRALDEVIKITNGNVQQGMRIIKYRIIGYKNKEIAEKLNISMSNLYFSLAQARNQLKTNEDYINILNNI